MTYSLLQDDKYIGHMASISGYDKLLKFSVRVKDHYPELHNFLDNGYTSKSDAVAQEAMSALRHITDGELVSVLTDLHKNLKGKSGTVYVGDA